MSSDNISSLPLGISLSKITEESTVDSVVNAIRNAIISGKYKPGDRLPAESELVASFGVSRGTIREAMKILQAYGVVQVKQGNGTYISKETDDIATRALIMRYALLQPTQKECWEYRAMFEAPITRNAILYATNSDLEALHANLRKMKLMKANPDITAKIDVEFHILLGNCTSNRLIRSTYALAISFLESTFAENHRHQNHVEKSIAVHEQTLKAIEMRDASDEMIQKLLDLNEESWIRNP